MLHLAFCVLTATIGAESDDLRVLPERVDGHLPSEMMHQYLLARVHEATDRRDREYEKLQTPEQLVDYQRRMHRFFVDKLGGFPQRTPLNARVVGREQRDGYRIEKVIFESQPRHYVTAILYLPESDPPYPGVLVPCGHSSTGKARDLYQRAPIVIAKNGMAAICYDPIDQGERHQLIGEDRKPVISASTMGHNLAGVGAILLGRNTATYRTWDGMRAIDYLQSRSEIDPERIGCTGISGGGTMTSYLMALDDRIFAAAPGCYLTSFRRLLDTIGPQDAEQDIHGQIAFGMDHADYVIMRSPKPTLIMTATEDYFDIDGAWHNFRQAKRFYTRQGFAERVDLFETDGKHGFPPAMRVAACRWMRRWLLQVDDAITETDFPIAEEKDVWCTPEGEVMLLPGARSVYDLNVELEDQLAKRRETFWRKNDKAKALDEVRRITGIRRLADLPQPTSEKTGTIKRDGYRIDKLIIRPEAGMALPALAFVPAERNSDTYLYVHAGGKHVDAAPGGRLDGLARDGHIVLAVDLRGIGETSRGDKHRYSSHLGPAWREVMTAYLLGTSYLAMRAEDVLNCARFMATYESGQESNRVHLISVGRTGPPALHAAALEPESFTSGGFENCLISWDNVVRTPLAMNQFESTVHGALTTYDLPDLLRTLPADKFTAVEPLDAAEKPVAGRP